MTKEDEKRSKSESPKKPSPESIEECPHCRANVRVVDSVGNICSSCGGPFALRGE